jgi:small GTP-binding protein domain
MTQDLFTVTPPLVAIVGRPNVGKSTLFNRMLGKRSAIVDDVPGVTRDRNYADASYRGRPFRLVDTGGLDPTSSDSMLSLIRQQSQIAIAEADVLVFVMDGRAGLTPADEEIATLLRPVKKPVFYAINKVDTPTSEGLMTDFYRLGKDTLFPTSAEHGIGVDDLLEAVYPLLPQQDTEAGPTAVTRVAVVGRPNVGKSTLINTLLDEERMVVSDVPGTTRDPIDTAVLYDGVSTFSRTRPGCGDEAESNIPASKASACPGP